MNRPPDAARGGSPHRRDPRRGSIPPGPGGSKPETIRAIWGADYLKDGYFDSNGHLRIEYVQRDRVEPLARTMCQASPPLTTGQLRRFFQHCRAIEARLKGRRSSWDRERRHVALLDAAAQDAVGKSPRKIPELFFDFISRNIQTVRTEADFLEGFLPHFEALVGFGARYLRRERS
ncbi:MAG: type III-A CRISPR-associated protein Csm2 [Gemmatimonadetes bacterium]|nr:type III-A CRISPR-associated protein Csm2 [Gemmatimonadota bacterium]